VAARLRAPLVGPFDIENLVAEVLALIEKLGSKQVDLVGHDWGAAITYAACAMAPQRVHRAVTLALPHPVTFLRMLKTGAQIRRSWYMALFQIPGSERLVRPNDMALVNHRWRTWLPKLEGLASVHRAATERAGHQSPRDLAGGSRFSPTRSTETLLWGSAQLSVIISAEPHPG
jgi:pimeloyl-ACP methyl ester carboxylesterase